MTNKLKLFSTKLLTVALLVSFFSCLSCTAGKTIPDRYFDEKNNVEHFMKSTVAILNPETGGPLCTGFFISPELILTARHCFINEPDASWKAQEKEIKERRFDLNTYNMYKTKDLEAEDLFHPVARVVYYPIDDEHAKNDFKKMGDTHDMAILKLTNSNKWKSKHWLTIAKKNASPGERIFSVSQPGGLPWFLAEGTVSQHLYDKKFNPFRVDFLLINVYIDFGSSGSPIINKRGEVVGLGHSKNRSNNLALFIPSSTINEILDRYVYLSDPRLQLDL